MAENKYKMKDLKYFRKDDAEVLRWLKAVTDDKYDINDPRVYPYLWDIKNGKMPTIESGAWWFKERTSTDDGAVYEVDGELFIF